MRCLNLLLFSFIEHILNILSVCPDPKVFRVHAKRIIRKWQTIMKDMFILRDATIVNNPRDSMRFFMSFFVIDSAVSFMRMSANPEPTSFCFFDVFPKSNIQRNASFGSIASSATNRTVIKEWFLAINTSRIISHLKVSPLGAIPRTAKTVAGLFIIEDFKTEDSYAVV